jgi:hypothetical protein
VSAVGDGNVIGNGNVKDDGGAVEEQPFRAA